MLVLNSFSDRHASEFRMRLVALWLLLSDPFHKVLWSCLVFYQTFAIWKPSLDLKQNQFGNILTDPGHVFLKIKQEGILYFGITVAHPARSLVYIWVQYNSWKGYLCATGSVSMDLNEAWLLLPCIRASTLCVFWEQRITSIQGYAIATMVTYLPRYGSSCYDFFFPAYSWIWIGMNQLKLVTGIFRTKGYSGGKPGN